MELTQEITGLVLAAGAGRRFGEPKALATAVEGVPWLSLATHTLRDAGCTDVIVVLGAAAEAARALVPDDLRVEIVVAEDWSTGMSASVRAGLVQAELLRARSHEARVLQAGPAVPAAEAVLITLVDLPGLPVEVATRVISDGPVTRSTLRQAVFDGRPGHPVLIGRDHWAPLIAQLDTAARSSTERDSGARRYLIDHGVTEVECGDLWNGEDIDTQPAPLATP